VTMSPTMAKVRRYCAKTQHSERVHLYMLRRQSVSAGCC